VALSFPPDTVYLYKAFTHPDFRGAGVHRATFVRASRWLTTLGLQRIVLIVELANWESLRSHERLGFRTLGLIVTAGRGRWFYERHPHTDKQLGLRFGAQADLSDRMPGGKQRLCSSAQQPPCPDLRFALLAQAGQRPAGTSASRLDRCLNDFQETTG
jgi:hypothetical protein